MGYFFALLKDMGRRSRTNMYGTTLWSGNENNIASRTAIYKSDHSFRFGYFHFFVIVSGLFCCVLVPGTLAFHLLHALTSNCDYLVYSVSQSVTT